MARNERPTVTFRDAEFIFRTNFRGEKSQYNKMGRREFNVVVEDPELAERLKSDGWNIKHTTPRDEGDEPTYFMPVTVAFDNYPPDVYMIDSVTKKRTKLDEDTIGQLDYADIVKINLEVNGYTWDVDGRSGIKAYTSRLNVFIKPNPFADDFEDEPDHIQTEEVPF